MQFFLTSSRQFKSYLDTETIFFPPLKVYENISDNQLSFFGECIPHILKLISVLWRETFRNEANNVMNYPALAKYRFIKGQENSR